MQNVDIALNENNVKEVFKAIWDGRTESDRFNQLILVAGIAWREVMMLRTYARYLKQIGIAYSQTYIAETLIANAAITKQLVVLFHLCFDPTVVRDVNETQRIENQIIQALNDVASLDQDKIIRRYLNVLSATLRTNFYQQTETSAAKNIFHSNLIRIKSQNCQSLGRRMRYLCIRLSLKEYICARLKSRAGIAMVRSSGGFSNRSVGADESAASEKLFNYSARG